VIRAKLNSEINILNKRIEDQINVIGFQEDKIIKLIEEKKMIENDNQQLKE